MRNLHPLVALLLVACVVPAAAADRPNLLIIHTDEHHFNTLGCYGGEIVGTPNIDGIAKRGALCTSFYATTPVCSPSRSALVSGRYPQNTPVVTNDIPMRDDIVTFAAVLADKGYATGYAGKWHLDGAGKPQWAPDRKFGFQDNRFMFNRGHWKLLELASDGPRVAARNAKDQPTYGVEGADEESFTTDWLADRAIEFIEENADRPFCYMVSIPDPHGPNTVRSPYDTMYDDVEVPIPSTLNMSPEEIPNWGKPEKVTAAALRKFMPQYYGMVKCIDDNVGRILAALDAKGLTENTIVVFTADHGDLCGEHGRLNKGVPYEGSAKVPFLIASPGQIDQGLIVDEALSCVDFMPTILSLMDVTCPDTVEGRDASPLFLSEINDAWEDVAFLRGTGNWLAAVSNDHKLIFSQNDPPWLFDLAKDPEERVNRFADPAYREVVRELSSALQSHVKRTNDPRGQEEKIAGEIAAAAGE